MLRQLRAVRFRNRLGLIIMKFVDRIVVLASLLLVAPLLHADGCVDSPECPTAILGVVGVAGAALYARWRSR
jgi:XrtJ-associated TM-motif-TM protein